VSQTAKNRRSETGTELHKIHAHIYLSSNNKIPITRHTLKSTGSSAEKQIRHAESWQSFMQYVFMLS